MSELKELAFEAAARGSPSGIVLVVFLIIGGIVQQQAPPSSPGTQNVFVETRLICPSLLSETALEKALPRAMARKSEDDDSNRSVRKKSTNGTLQLPEFAVPLLSSLLQLVPAAGLRNKAPRDSVALSGDGKQRASDPTCSGPPPGSGRNVRRFPACQICGNSSGTNIFRSLRTRLRNFGLQTSGQREPESRATDSGPRACFEPDGQLLHFNPTAAGNLGS
jgi:hypothetical protein